MSSEPKRILHWPAAGSVRRPIHLCDPHLHRTQVDGGERPAGCSDAPILWETTGGDETLVPDPDVRMRVWVLDVEGYRLVIWAGEESDQSVSDDLQALIDTIQIQAP